MDKQGEDHLNKLTDAYIAQVIEKEVFENQKTTLLLERRDMEEKLTECHNDPASPLHRLTVFLELSGSVYFQYKMANSSDRNQAAIAP
jgi:hypothetical protein